MAMAVDAAKELNFAKALMQSLPETVRVGVYEFRIEKWNQHQASANRRWGECSTVEQFIRLQVDMPTRYKAVDTVMHELMHAMYWAYGVQDEDKEERVVIIMASALAALHRDNPWLAIWIQAAKL
jgi:hypothetical protein